MDSPELKESGGFAEGLEEEPLYARKATVVEDGLFGNDDMMGGEKETKKLAGGLFDNSDDEAEMLKSKMEDQKVAEAAAKKK